MRLGQPFFANFLKLINACNSVSDYNVTIIGLFFVKMNCFSFWQPLLYNKLIERGKIVKQLCILPCGKKKIWDKYPNAKETKAEDAYIGVLHRLCRRYTELYCDNWVIISAKHGLLLPDNLVPENYDLTFQVKHPPDKLTAKLKQQVIEKDLTAYQDIIVLTGKKYQPIIQQTFTHARRIQFPLLGTKGIGDMQRLLKNSIENQKPLHLMEGRTIQ